MSFFFSASPFAGTEIQVGGLLGDLMNSGLNSLFSSTGTLIVLLAAGSLYVIIATGFSFKKLFLAVGRMFSFAFQEVRIKIAERPKPARAPASRMVEKKPGPPAEEPEEKKAGGEDAPPPAEPDETKRARRERKRLEREKSKELVSKPIKPFQPELPKPEQFVLPEFDTLSGYHIPPLTLLDPGKPVEKIDKNELFEKKTRIEEKLREFRVEGEVKEYHPGPVITTYEFYPNPGIKISQVANLSEDVSLALGAESVRIQRIPGKSSLGVEIPNNKREVIKLRDIIASENFTRSPSKLTFALGKTVHDEVYVTDLDVMPHLLIAGATGTGKSVCLNALIASIMYKASPQEVKLHPHRPQAARVHPL